MAKWYNTTYMFNQAVNKHHIVGSVNTLKFEVEATNGLMHTQTKQHENTIS